MDPRELDAKPNFELLLSEAMKQPGVTDFMKLVDHVNGPKAPFSVAREQDSTVKRDQFPVPLGHVISF